MICEAKENLLNSTSPTIDADQKPSATISLSDWSLSDGSTKRSSYQQELAQVPEENPLSLGRGPNVTLDFATVEMYVGLLAAQATLGMEDQEPRSMGIEHVALMRNEGYRELVTETYKALRSSEFMIKTEPTEVGSASFHLLLRDIRYLLNNSNLPMNKTDALRLVSAPFTNNEDDRYRRTSFYKEIGCLYDDQIPLIPQNYDRHSSSYKRALANGTRISQTRLWEDLHRY